MYIYWLGESSFKIKTENASIIIDPASKNTGLAQNSLQADLVLLSNTLEHNIKRVKPASQDSKLFIIDTPGEYEIKNIFIYGIQGDENNILYLIKTEGIEIAHLAGLNNTLNDKQLGLFEGADIVMVPVGNQGILSGKQTDSVISQIEPKIVIPMNYQIPKLKIKRDPVDLFLSEMGAKDIKPEKSLYIKKQKLTHEETKIALLQC